MKTALKTSILILAALLTLLLAGCGTEEETMVDEGVGETYESEALDTSYDGALSVSNQLALGTMQLEETDLAVTSEQASALLPLWQALQQGGVTAEAEVNAVLAQIEGAMTGEQLAAIATMMLTQEDMQVWMEEQGPGMGGFGPGAGGFGPGEGGDMRATRQAEFGDDVPPEMATRQAQFEGMFAGMSDEELESLRATMQAGGGFPGGEGGGFGGEGGGFRGEGGWQGGGSPGGPGGRGGRRFSPVLRPLVELLEERAGE